MPPWWEGEKKMPVEKSWADVVRGAVDATSGVPLNEW
jgi:hypothetical protein